MAGRAGRGTPAVDGGRLSAVSRAGSPMRVGGSCRDAPASITSPERRTMISGVHAVVFSRAAGEVRAFFRDTLRLPYVDGGEGWLIFALPPAELAVRPSEA